MSMPQFLKKSEILEKVKNKLNENSNINILEQFQYEEKSRGMPSFKLLSFILFQDKETQTYFVAKTSNLDIEQITMSDFKNINTEKFTEESIEKYNKFSGFIDGLLKKNNKNKL
jgi:hypothetical protein